MSDAARSFGVVHLEDGVLSSRAEQVAHEEPLEIQVNGASVAVVMRTPGDDLELATGFLLTERIVGSITDIESMRHCTQVPDPAAEDNVLQVRLKPDVPFDLARLRRHMFASSSCGVCGKATIEHACATAAPLDDAARVSAAVLSTLSTHFLAAQTGFAETGGLHAAGLFTLDGELVALREDVGRHNAVDKVIGVMAQRRVPPAAHLLLVSGRVSFELVQKVAAARIPLIAGISAPSSLAVSMARALHVTLVGFLRGASMNVYAGPERVVSSETAAGARPVPRR